MELDEDLISNIDAGAQWHYVVIEAAYKSQYKYFKRWHNRSVKYKVNLGWGRRNTVWLYVRYWGKNQHQVHGSFSAFAVNVKNGAMDNLSNYEKMISFVDANQWTISRGEFSFDYGSTAEASKITATLTNTSEFDLIGNAPIDYYVGSDVERIKMRVKLSFPIEEHYYNGYCGNVQVLFADGCNWWFDWAGQFDINKYSNASDNGEYFAEYEFILPTHFTEKLKENPQRIKLHISGNSGDKYSIYEIDFSDADSEKNRNLTTELNMISSKPHTELLNDAISYSTFISGTSGNSIFDKETIVYKDNIESGKRYYYNINQESDYPMSLVEIWALNVAYEPGNIGIINGNWRQCWYYLGKKSL